jgi:uncharacterized protein YegL
VASFTAKAQAAVHWPFCVSSNRIAKGCRLLLHRATTFQPWIFLITDGEPTDQWQTAASRVKEKETAKKLAFFAVGVEDANMEVLRAISVRQPVKLKGLEFRKLFDWLTRTQISVSHSTPGQQVPLPNPAAPDGWATI